MGLIELKFGVTDVCVCLCEQLVEDLQSYIPSQFVQSIFSLESPVLMLRYMASEKVGTHTDRTNQVLFCFVLLWLLLVVVLILVVVLFVSCWNLSMLQLLNQLIKLYNSFLAIRNIPLLDNMYR